MRKYILIFAFALCSAFVYGQETTTYYFIRHAEKVRVNPNDKDPGLSYDGFKRADKWSKVFEKINISAVYSTDYNRTKLTAKPTADANGLPVLLYNPSKMYTESFQYNTKGKNVLVVGHSNTTPMFVNKILGKEKYKAMSDDDNSSLYIVTVTGNTITDTVVVID